ncbi:MAG: glycosyltransferase family 2 protein [Acidobacteria bacterium]|nr:glycosyltransferase family 2 protein [Acidobacteriota bacterium]
MAAALPEPTGRGGNPAAPAVSVIVVNWRREEATVSCGLRVLAWEELSPALFVVDNGSGAAVVARIASQLAGATVCASSSNLGFGGANNLVLDDIASEFVLLLNNDAEINEESVTRLVRFLENRPEAGVAGPVLESTAPQHHVIAAGGRNVLRYGRTHYSAAERAAELQASHPYSVDYVPGTVALIRCGLLRRLGGFDEDYFFSGEMADLCARAMDAGFGSFVVPTARAAHDLDQAGPLRASLYPYYSLRNRFLFIRRHRHRTFWPSALWTARGMLRWITSLATGHVALARGLGLALVHGLRGRFGAAPGRLS